MKEIYLLSGLGSDKRVFDFLDLSGYRSTCIEWIGPEENESIQGYAKRLLAQVKTPKPVLLGVSFGGLIAVEIGKLIETDKIILVSSIKTKNDLPLYYRLLSRLQPHKLLPGKALKSTNPITFWFFGAKTREEKNLLKSILDATDAGFMHWGIDKLINWKNGTAPKNAVLIHGTEDRILPQQHVDYPIQGGGHFMIINRAQEISKLIRTLLN